MFVRTLPGLESTVRRELSALNILASQTKPSKGVITIPTASASDIYSATALLRCASRVLIPLFKFRAPSFSYFETELKKKRSELEPFIIGNVPIDVKVTTTASKLWHEKAIRERFLRIIGLPDAAPSSSTTQRIELSFSRDVCEVRLDAGGVQPLHEHGWRVDAAKMPLKECVASAMLMACGWADKPTSLIDPFCGSGTIPIEAALLALNMPPNRSFAFEEWPGADTTALARVSEERERRTHEAASKRASVPPIVGSDRDDGAVKVATLNAEKAGVSDLVEFRAASVSALAAPAEKAGGGGLLMTNPPWGLRSGKDRGQRQNLYAKLGSVFTERLDGWGLALLVNDGRLLAPLQKHQKLALHKTLSVSLGGERATLVANQGAGGSVELAAALRAERDAAKSSVRSERAAELSR